MKKCTALLLLFVLVASLLLTGCDANDTEPDGDDSSYSFFYNGVSIAPGGSFDAIKSELGAYTSCFEAASCAFDGNDQIYTYGSVQINVSPLAGVNTIYMVTLLDDSLATPEGVRVGSARDEVVAAYGDSGIDRGTSLVYVAGMTELVFILRDGCVTSVQYRWIEVTDAG